MWLYVCRGDVRTIGDGNSGGTGMVPGTAGNDADASVGRRNGDQQSKHRPLNDSDNIWCLMIYLRRDTCDDIKQNQDIICSCKETEIVAKR